MIFCTKCGREKEEGEFRFKIKKLGILSSRCKVCSGEHDKDYYKKHKKEKYASEARRIKKNRRAEGSTGVLGRFRILLPRLRYSAKLQGYKPPCVTPEDMLRIWERQKGFCVACGGPMQLLGFNGSCFDHDHETGEPRGFVHKNCNTLEGLFSGLLDEQVQRFLVWMRSIRFVATGIEADEEVRNPVV
jgi:Recombination endonuclease VII